MLAVKIVSFSLVILLLSFVYDSYSHKKLKPEYWFGFEKGTRKSKTLIVYLPGDAASATLSSLDLIDVWKTRGDVMLIEYGKEKFDADLIADWILSEIMWKLSVTLDNEPPPDYKEVIFIGSFEGGLLAYDVLQKMKEYNIQPSIKLYVIDAPTSIKDIYYPRSVLVRLIATLPFGAIWNRLGLTRFVLTRHNAADNEYNVDLDEIERRKSESESYNLSFVSDQWRYIINHGVPETDSLHGIVEEVTYIKSKRDHKTVRFDAFTTWRNAAPNVITYFSVDSDFDNFAGRPETWKKKFKELFDVH